MSVKKIAILLLHAFAGWLLCDLTMVVGMATTSLGTALVVHAIGAPVYFAVVSTVYFSKFHYTSPIATAAMFVGFVMVVDFLLVALVINRSLDMFTSLLGTWIPFALIFSSTLLVGLLHRSKTT